MKQNLILGADIGGSHITTALVDLKTSAVVPASLTRRPVNSHGTAGEVIAVWSEALLAAAGASQLIDQPIGIALPGPFDYDKGISLIKNQDKYEELYSLNVKEMLAGRTGTTPGNIRLLNDAGAFLQGEIFAGAGIGFNKVIGVTLGTGLGTSRYHHGQADDANLWCSPFLNSIAEDYLSSRWFVKRYAQLTGQQEIDVKALAAIAAQDKQAAAVFTEFGHNLGLFLSDFIRQDQPELLVLGGNISKAAKLFLPETEKVLARQQVRVQIKTAALGETAALFGAVSCWREHTPVVVQD